MALTLHTMTEVGRQRSASRRGNPFLMAHDALAEVDLACGKFPLFPDRLLLPDEMQCDLARQLDMARQCNDTDGGAHATGYSVFVEEFLEFCEAAQAGDLEAARKELTQAMAMLLRIGVHLEHYCEQARAVVNPENG